MARDAAGTGASPREERLRAALMANVGRRKAQGRARAAEVCGPLAVDAAGDGAVDGTAPGERKDEADG